MSSIARSQYMRCVLAVLLCLAIRPVLVLNAQAPQYLRLELLRAQLLDRDFERRQNDFRAWKLQERRRVPTYNAQLNSTVIDSQSHLERRPLSPHELWYLPKIHR